MNLQELITNGQVDLRKFIEIYSLNFSNLTIDDVRYIEAECRELRQKFEDAEKVDCYRTRKLFDVGWSDEAYFEVEEFDRVKELAKKAIDEGFFDFEVKKLRISKLVLAGHITERKQGEHHE